eukprot:CAMPEP_0197463538 /NCGR_PEP_ID=MMETSP1175-20131217/62088_1 /TAXON_ID=1003142 /ORGANISM="Triceratium dubium, Strain CCMP147" /LENGTH=72 /DNA_ID=CAMNT_0042999329 /DNA_START=166 /DNA_END=381 /DNA_ORIENTATION=-
MHNMFAPLKANRMFATETSQLSRDACRTRSEQHPVLLPLRCHAKLDTERCSTSTPLGRPVLPEVNSTYARFS